MTLDQITDYLEAMNCGRIGKTLFQYEMPAECKEGLLLLNGYYGNPIDHYLPGYRVAEVRLSGRSTDLKRVEELVERASKALTIQGGSESITGIYLKQSLPQNEPRVYRRSVGGYWELEVDFTLHYTLR
jgi:hypothetical protein